MNLNNFLFVYKLLLNASKFLYEPCQDKNSLCLCEQQKSRHYVNVPVLIKFSLKTSVFYLNFYKISIKLYVVDVY